MARSVFSAVDALKSKSSMVAVNVASLPSHWILVTTFVSSLKVLTFKPIGVLKLSGEIALATASAVFSSSYSSVIVASNLLDLQLFADKFINSFNKILNFIQRHRAPAAILCPPPFPPCVSEATLIASPKLTPLRIAASVVLAENLAACSFSTLANAMRGFSLLAKA